MRVFTCGVGVVRPSGAVVPLHTGVRDILLARHQTEVARCTVNAISHGPLACKQTLMWQTVNAKLFRKCLLYKPFKTINKLNTKKKNVDRE